MRCRGRSLRNGGDGNGDVSGTITADVDQSSGGERSVVVPDVLRVRLFAVFAVVRVVSALWNPVGDCDETFNYWEPTHFLMYGNGFQTWEYSPEHALRSYLYIGVHALLGHSLRLVGVQALFGKIGVFFGIRIAFGLVCAYVESRFAMSLVIVMKRGGDRNQRAVRMTAADFWGFDKFGFWLMLFQVLSPGMFVASTAFLPQTFAMFMLMLCFDAWLRESFGMAVFWMGAAALIGWPFAVLLGIPLGLHILVRCGLWSAARWAITSVVVLTVPLVLVDLYYFRRVLLAPVNIAIYNGVHASKGGNLYGIEPFTYYIVNLTLNFNVVFIVSMHAYIVAFLKNGVWGFDGPEGTQRYHRMMSFLLYCGSPIAIWLGIMFSMAHKEERFLFVVYPLITAAAAYTMSEVYAFFRILESDTMRKRRDERFQGGVCAIIGRWMRRLGCTAVFVAFVLLSVSRSVALVNNYSATFHAYTFLNHDLAQRDAALSKPANRPWQVCVGKEWYRFPSRFFLPAGVDVDVQFLKSDFSGLLPKAFSQHANATWIVPTEMNDMNREEPSRYVQPNSCDYIVDLDLPYQREQHFAETSQWTVLHAYPFLDARNSHALLRALFIPRLSNRRNTFAPYQVLHRRQD